MSGLAINPMHEIVMALEFMEFKMNVNFYFLNLFSNFVLYF